MNRENCHFMWMGKKCIKQGLYSCFFCNQNALKNLNLESADFKRVLKKMFKMFKVLKIYGFMRWGTGSGVSGWKFPTL